MNIVDLKRRFPDTTDQKRHFLVTEVTKMKNAVCVATIDLQMNRITRPLQWNQSNWPESLVDEGLRPGCIVRQQIRRKQESKGFPHQSEDVQLTNTLEIVETISDVDLFSTLLPLADESVDAMFDGHITNAQYVVDGSNCRSLGSVLVNAADVDLSTNAFGAVRIEFIDNARQRYNLKITEYAYFQDLANVERAQRYIALGSASGAQVIIRVGLARGWNGNDKAWNPKRCYLQANGLIFHDR